jgi:hypothetical protein
MNKEYLRMQKLAGVITEGQYKEKLEEISISGTLKKIGDKIVSIPVFDKLIDKIVSNMSEKDVETFKSRFNLNEAVNAPSLEDIFSKVHSSNPDKDVKDEKELNEALDEGTLEYKIVNLIRNITGLNLLALGGVFGGMLIGKALVIMGMTGPIGAMIVGPFISLFASLIIHGVANKLLGRTGHSALVGD